MGTFWNCSVGCHHGASTNAAVISDANRPDNHAPIVNSKSTYCRKFNACIFSNGNQIKLGNVSLHADPCVFSDLCAKHAVVHVECFRMCAPTSTANELTQNIAEPPSQIVLAPDWVTTLSIFTNNKPLARNKDQRRQRNPGGVKDHQCTNKLVKIALHRNIVQDPQ